MIKHHCGCINSVEKHGALKSFFKCAYHRSKQREIGDLGLDYYEELGAVVNSAPQGETHVAELLEALGCISMNFGGSALEVGCGCSNYVAYIVSRGYTYTGLEASTAACEWTRKAYGVSVVQGRIETFTSSEPFDMILAAHCIEHIPDAPAALTKLYGLLKPHGSLYLIIPDDSDKLNPDHLWFFSVEALNATLDDVGFVVERCEVRRRVKHENFIYVKATRRGS